MKSKLAAQGLKNRRFFLCRDTLSTIDLQVPDAKQYSNEYEVTMRDCSRQIHWLFDVNRAGLAKAKKVAKFWNELVAELEQKLGSKR